MYIITQRALAVGVSDKDFILPVSYGAGDGESG